MRPYVLLDGTDTLDPSCLKLGSTLRPPCSGRQRWQPFKQAPLRILPKHGLFANIVKRVLRAQVARHLPCPGLTGNPAGTERDLPLSPVPAFN